MRQYAGLLAAVLARPESAAALDLAEWSVLIKQARVAALLGQLHARLEGLRRHGLVPAPAHRHLEIAGRLAERHRAAVRWELMHVRDAISELDIPVILLKGAAYFAAGTRAASGRIFDDIDILVPRDQLDRVEASLIRAGWLPAPVSAYDQRYYRKWTHELPPMEHKRRGTVLDVHHTILPPTSGIVPDTTKLIGNAVPVQVPGLESFSVLSPEDMVIHSACHLFFGEFQKGLRDLYDLHMLFGAFGVDQSFWRRLESRALEAGLARPVLDAMEHAHRVFGTEVPETALRHLHAALGKPAFSAVRAWMFGHVLLPNHPSCAGAGARYGRWLAYARSHWLRMPLPLLIYHLGYKALKGGTH